MALPNILVEFLDLLQYEILTDWVLRFLQFFNQLFAYLIFFEKFFSVGYLKNIKCAFTKWLAHLYFSFPAALAKCWTLEGLWLAVIIVQIIQ